MWLAIHLPALPLQVYARAQADAAALAVSEHGRLIACNQAARQQGLRPGLSDGAARALAAELRILPRRARAEPAALVQLATWALGFSDQVSLDLGPGAAAPGGRRGADGTPPAMPALVLEAARSLCLFGGAAALHRKVTDGLTALGWHARVVLAPTPAGALLLAIAGQHGLVPDPTALRAALAALPVAALGLTRQDTADLAAMGIRHLGALLRLPRAGLAERLGPGRVAQLERLLGERPDPRRAFVPPARFQADLELPAEVPDAGALVFACRRLLADLGAFLRARQGGVQRLTWRLRHADLPSTDFQLGAAWAERDPDRWLLLLRARLERLALPAPVRAISLTSEPLRALPAVALDLPGLAPAAKPGIPASDAPDPTLLDHLRARLGEAAVCGLVVCGDHRPERAWGLAAPGTPTAPVAAGMARADRPLWLLPAPQPLPLRGRRPWYDGPLALGTGCERIDTGWWDGFVVARDYYVATTVTGERLWIYRELHGERGWFLHGWFG